MIHGYHVVFGTYGYWLPNDMRGSWSDFVGSWELRLLGPSTKHIERSQLNPDQHAWQRKAKQSLQYPEVELDGKQALAVARGFQCAIQKSRLTVWACSILPQHVHLVIARHRFKVEYIAGLLKGEATKELKRSSLHPLADYTNSKGETPTPWNARSYHGFLDSAGEIENAIAYVVENPMKEGKRRQHWKFVTPFAGIEDGIVSYP